MSKYVASISFGKDSLAMLIKIKEQRYEKLDQTTLLLNWKKNLKTLVMNKIL